MPDRRSKLVFAVSSVVVLLMLAGLAVVLANSQAEERDDLEERFANRPELSAALTSGLFTATTASPEQQRQLTNRYGQAEPPSEATLTEQAREGSSVFVALLDREGGLIATSKGTPRGLRPELEPPPEYVEAVLDGAQPTALSDFLDLGNERVLAFAQPVQGAEPRILVTGFPPDLLAAFLGQTLAEVVGITGGGAYILDSTGAVVASSAPGVAPGEPVPVPELATAVEDAPSGSFGSDEYFAAASIENSTWRVVSVAPEADVFAGVEGWDKWAPWLIFAGFVLAAGAAFFLLWRVLAGAAELAEAHMQLDASNRALRQRAQALERSNADLDQFASVASHDLKEPLRKVQTFSQRALELDGDGISDRGRDYLRRSSEAARRMQRLIDDLLSFSRTPRPNREFANVSLDRVLRGVISDLERSIEDTGAAVELGELPGVAGDESQIRQLFQNLISNAIKFRREGVPPLIRIEGEAHGDLAEIRVIDNGIGFDQRYATRIFRVFERLHGRTEYEGTGIGLALCRKIAERHGGRISADSTPGGGSTFTVVLPTPSRARPGATLADEARREVTDVNA